MTSFTIYDHEIYKKFGVIARELHGHGGINKLIWEFIKKVVDEHDGMKNGLDNYFGIEHLQKPDVDADFETKILPWLRTLNDEKLHSMSVNFNRGFIHTKALLDTPQENRRSVGFDFMTIWRKYK